MPPALPALLPLPPAKYALPAPPVEEGLAGGADGNLGAEVEEEKRRDDVLEPNNEPFVIEVAAGASSYDPSRQLIACSSLVVRCHLPVYRLLGGFGTISDYDWGSSMLMISSISPWLLVIIMKQVALFSCLGLQGSIVHSLSRLSWSACYFGRVFLY